MRQSFVVLSLVAAVATVSACGSSSAPMKAPATWNEQVAAGQTLYGANCAKCHGDSGQGTEDAPRVVGLKEGALPLDPPATRKVRKTRFVTVGDVADFAVHNMPPKKAGSLGTEEYLAILAFDLHANGLDLPTPLTLQKAKETTIPR